MKYENQIKTWCLIFGWIMGALFVVLFGRSCHAEESKGYDFSDKPLVQPVVPVPIYPQPGYVAPVYAPPPLLYPRPDPVYAPYIQVGPSIGNNIPNGIYQYNPNFQHVIIEQRGYYGR